MLHGLNGIRSTHTSDGGVVLDIGSGKIFSLNPSASFIFQLLEGGSSDGQIVEQLVERFRISSELAQNDLAEFRQMLKAHSILPSQ